MNTIQQPRVASTPPATILIIEDDTQQLAMLQEYLTECNIEILSARSGEQGVTSARQVHPALILLSAVMPQMDGFEICRRLKADAGTRHIPVIFMIAPAETGHTAQAFQIGAADYITKPLQKEEVLARVRAQLQAHTLAGELERAVQARTDDLRQVNQQLQHEMAERERALRESEAKYRNLVEFAKDGVIIVQDWILQYVNKYLAELCGYTVSEMIGQPLHDFLAPDEISKVSDYHRRRLAGEDVPHVYETAIRHHNGRAIAVEFNSSETVYLGQPAIQVFVHDITIRKQMEAALQRRITALTQPVDDTQNISFTDMFNLAEIQEIQDAFAAATGVSSGITTPDGVQLTRYSNPCPLCEIVRQTPKGEADCKHSNILFSYYKFRRPSVQPCLSLGLLEGGARIVIDDRCIAIWRVGYVRDAAQDEEELLAYAREIGADEAQFRAALAATPVMSKEQFATINRALFLLANLMSRIAYQNIQQARLITDYEKVVQALGASEERLQNIVSVMPVMLQAFDAQNNLIYWNEECERVTGYTREEVRHNGDLMQRLYPEAAYRAQVYATLAAQAGDFENLEFALTRKDSTQRVVAWSNISHQAPIPGWDSWAVGVDITERKQAEEERLRLLAQIQEQAQRVQQIVDTVPEGMLLLDADQRIVMANPMATRDLHTLADAPHVGDRLTRLGDQPLTELLTSPPKGLWHEFTAANRVYQVIARSTETGPTPGGWVLVIRDITQQRDIDRRIQQQERLAAIGQLAAGIAHDFNNVMAAIMLYAQMTSRAPEISERIRERMVVINQQAQHATNLIRQILDFSRRAVVERRPLDLMPFLNEQVKLFKRTLPENITIAFTHDTNEYLVNADPTSIQQMLMNLVVNARDAMPEGGNLQIRLTHFHGEKQQPHPLPAPTAGDWVQLCIADTGEGIPPEIQEHIFEPFFTTKSPGQGTGLGLAQVHGIVGLHEGHITLESEKGRGAAFTIYLPALETRGAEVAPEVETHLIKGHGDTILVVEDNAIARAALRESLELLNYRTLAATNGKEALQILTERAADIALVLSDVMMPEMGGIALLHALRERGLHHPTLLLTGHPLENELTTLQTTKSHTAPIEWMLKPPALEQLSEKIAKLLHPPQP